MQNQENQLLTVTRILRDNLKVSMEEYQDNLEFISEIQEQNKDDLETFYKKFLDTQQNFICNLYREDSEENIIVSAVDMVFENPVKLAEYPDEKSIWMMSDEKEKYYLVFKKKEKNEEQTCLAVDAGKYYQRLISDIHVGTNGYIIIKDKKGVIIMHPDKEQWGQEIIESRKNAFRSLITPVWRIC